MKLLFAITILAFAHSWSACGQHKDSQTPSGDIGLGGQIGDPSGISFKVYRARATGEKFLGAARAVELVAAWDLDRFVSLTGHGLIEEPIEDSPLNYFVGPGIVLGVDAPKGDASAVVGLSGVVGVNFFSGRFEVYLQATPTLRLIPRSDGVFGGSIGFRFYFGSSLTMPEQREESPVERLV